MPQAIRLPEELTPEPLKAPDGAALPPGSVWLHKKSKRRYVVVGLSTAATNGSEGGLDVVYLNPETRRMYSRRWYEFLDGRFVKED